MLKKWIHEIRQNPDLYDINCWKYHISGNSIELLILPDYIKQKKLYRCSVIAVGQVLKVLSVKIEENNLSFHIQSFPNIENPEIVATIRMINNGEFHATATVPKQDALSNTASEIINNLASENQLYVEPIEDISTLDIDIEDVPFNDYNRWFKLNSTFNNPFTWLNIGYMKESIRQIFANKDSLKTICMIDCFTLKNEPEISSSKPVTKYLQYLIGVQE